MPDLSDTQPHQLTAPPATVRPTTERYSHPSRPSPHRVRPRPATAPGPRSADPASQHPVKRPV
jgi:hypothetical protein